MWSVMQRRPRRQSRKPRPVSARISLFPDQAAHLMQIAGDADAEILHLGIRQQQVRYHDGHHTGAGGRADAVMGILQRKAEGWIDAEPVGGRQKGIGIWLSPHIVAMRDDGL